MTADEWDRTDRYREMIWAATTEPDDPRVGLFDRPPPPPSAPERRMTGREWRFVLAAGCRAGVFEADPHADYGLVTTYAEAADLIDRRLTDALTPADRPILEAVRIPMSRLHAPAPEGVIHLAESSPPIAFLICRAFRLHDSLLPETSAVGCDLVRCVVGNPLRPAVAFDPTWRSSTVRELAASMHTANDFGPMPVLANALQDAGCGDERILTHARTGPHVRGCWVVEAIRGTP